MKLKTIVNIGILSTLFGCLQNIKKEPNKTYPKEEFAIVDAKLEDGRPAVGSFNLGYKNYNYEFKYPWCLKISIGIDLENCNENGLLINLKKLKL